MSTPNLETPLQDIFSDPDLGHVAAIDLTLKPNGAVELILYSSLYNTQACLLLHVGLSWDRFLLLALIQLNKFRMDAMDAC